MAAPTRIFHGRLDVKFTRAQAEAIQQKAALDGMTPSQVVRDAVTAYLLSEPGPTPEPKRVT